MKMVRKELVQYRCLSCGYTITSTPPGPAERDCPSCVSNETYAAKPSPDIPPRYLNVPHVDGRNINL